MKHLSRTPFTQLRKNALTHLRQGAGGGSSTTTASTVLRLGSPSPGLPPVDIAVRGPQPLVERVRLSYFDFCQDDDPSQVSRSAGGASDGAADAKAQSRRELRQPNEVLFDVLDPKRSGGSNIRFPVQLPRSLTVTTTAEGEDEEDDGAASSTSSRPGGADDVFDRHWTDERDPQRMVADRSSVGSAAEASVEATTRHPWRRAVFADWSVGQKVVRHADADHQLITRVKQNAALFSDHLEPHHRSAFFSASADLQQWIVSSAGAPHSQEDVARGIDLAYWSAMLPLLGGCWLRGDVVANADGKAVLILGRPQSGKTTLALHCLARGDPSLLRLVACDNFLLHNTGGRSGPRIVGSIAPPRVSIGTLLGTLLPNPSLEQLVDRNFAAGAVRNSDPVLWRMRSPHEVNVAEAFGPGRRALVAREIVGAVWLDWSVDRDGPAMVGQLPLAMLDFPQCAHPLLVDVHRPDRSDELPRSLLAACGVHVDVVRGSVRFEPVVKHILRMLA